MGIPHARWMSTGGTSRILPFPMVQAFGAFAPPHATPRALREPRYPWAMTVIYGGLWCVGTLGSKLIFLCDGGVNMPNFQHFVSTPTHLRNGQRGLFSQVSCPRQSMYNKGWYATICNSDDNNNHENKSNNNSKNNSNKDNDNNVCTVALYAFRVKSQSTRHALDVLMVWMGWPLFLAS